MNGFFFGVGAADITRYTRVTPGDGLDPYDPDLVSPEFSRSPLREGAVHVQDVVNEREFTIPVRLKSRRHAHTNLITNPDAQGPATPPASIDGWSPRAQNNADFQQVMVDGEPAFRLIRDTDAGGAQTIYMNSDPAVAVAPGQWVGLACEMQKDGSSPDIDGNLVAVGDVGGTQGAATVTPITSSTAWTRLTNVVQIEAGASTVQARVQFADAAEGDIYYARKVVMVIAATEAEAAAAVAEYFDGDDLDATWDGTPHDSTSTTRAGKGGLHDMVGELDRQLARPGVHARWRDSGATLVTYYDLLRGRFEPDFNYRRSEHNYADGVVRLWTQPYGHTATERIVATAAGAGVVVPVPISAAVDGDVPARLDARVTVGSQIPTGGRVVAVAVLPHPSYVARFPAASIGDRMAGAALIGASGAAGSQYLGLPISPTGGASGIAAKVALTIPSVYAGRNRLLAIARGRLEGGVAITVTDAQGDRLGPTAVASLMSDWGVVDLGTLTAPDPYPGPTSLKLSIAAGGLAPASGQPVPLVLGSPGLHLNEVFVLPEDSTALLVDGVPSQIIHDTFARDGDLYGSRERYGRSWASSFSQATTGIRTIDTLGGLAIGTQQSRDFAGRIDGISLTDSRLVANVQASNIGDGTQMVAVRRELDADSWVMARFLHAPSGILEVRHNNNGAASSVACAAIPIGSLADGGYELTLDTLGGRAFAALRPKTGGWSASVGGSHAQHGIPGNPGFWARNKNYETFMEDFAVYSAATNGLAPADVYRFDGVDSALWRQQSGGDLTARLEDRARGAVPGVPVVPTPAFVAFVAPLADGIANSAVSVEIRCREQVRFAW